MRGNCDVPAGVRAGFHEPNSPRLVEQLLGALDRGAIPVLAHPRWPAIFAADAMQRAGVGEACQIEAAATLLFTSGSTAAPKIVVHSLAAHLAAAHASAERVPFGPDHRWLLSLPLCHVGGLSLLFRTVVAGATLVLPEPDERLADAVLRTRPSHVSLVATQLRELLRQPRVVAVLAACEVVLLGGGPCPGELVRRALDAGVPLRRTYGMTEMGSQIATEPSGAARMVPLRGVDLRIDEAAELWVRGPARFLGYLVDEELELPFVDGWFPTGDLATLDDEAGLEIHGRRDNQFVSGGENVQPEAVEAAFAARGIEVVVVAVADERYGARPVAFTVDGAAHGAVAEQILPSYARPVAWLELPATRGLKLRRAELRRLAEARLGDPPLGDPPQ
ncbi:MAG: AMP-binding protein [bacterium]|nr:AMP-binding protein [bacterium]